MHKTHITDAKYRQAKPADKEYTLSDIYGLTMLVHPNGSKYWFVRYSFEGKWHKLNLGRYLDVPLRGYVTEVAGEQVWVNRQTAQGSALQLLKSLSLSLTSL